MGTSVGTKPGKKQPSPLNNLPEPAVEGAERRIERALLGLENACAQVLSAQFAQGAQDIERLTWQRRFKNIVTPVSLALVECKGPRRFHYHYRRREDDEAVLYPVLEPNPLATLAHVCENALNHCAAELTGIGDEAIVRRRDALEKSLRAFVAVYQQTIVSPPL